MSVLDIVLVALCAGLGILGVVQGLVRQLFSLGGLVLGHLLGAKYYGPAREALGISFEHSEIVAYLLLFVGAYLGVRLVGALVERLVRGSTLSGTDRFAGLLAGLAKGAVFAVLLVFVLVILLPRDAPLLRASRLAPRAVAAVEWAAPIFPDPIAEAFREKTSPQGAARGKGSDSPPPAQPKNRSRK
jgi:membrane protein required for colicin V production